MFREALEQYLEWTAADEAQAEAQLGRLLGTSGDDRIFRPGKLIFSDFQLSDYVKQQMLSEVKTETGDKRDEILQALSHQRTFTALSDEGIVSEGSLRSCRCVNKGLNFYSQVECSREDEELVAEVLSGIKWIGTMRNRGFGKVRLTVIE